MRVQLSKSTVNKFSDFVQERYIWIKSFSSQNIWRMKQFHETYKDKEKLSAVPREISWTNSGDSLHFGNF